ETEDELSDLKRDQQDLQDNYDSYRRRLTRQISDIEQSVAALQNDINKLNQEVFEKEDKDKKK
ncbi:MAG: hypothetical protein KAK01_07530, partial [Candidatus Marinimicrobia bacterium]|nr:hypothetical protein [Candidatus Neomarinimicrobiota bacterium]